MLALPPAPFMAPRIVAASCGHNGHDSATFWVVLTSFIEEGMAYSSSTPGVAIPSVLHSRMSLSSPHVKKKGVAEQCCTVAGMVATHRHSGHDSGPHLFSLWRR